MSPLLKAWILLEIGTTCTAVAFIIAFIALLGHAAGHMELASWGAEQWMAYPTIASLILLCIAVFSLIILIALKKRE